MNIVTKITEIAAKSNFLESGYIDVGNLKYYPEVRAICAAIMQLPGHARLR